MGTAKYSGMARERRSRRRRSSVARIAVSCGRSTRLPANITSGLMETKLLQARAALLEKDPVAAFVAVSASMDDLKDPAERQLARFLAASEPFPQYLASLPR